MRIAYSCFTVRVTPLDATSSSGSDRLVSGEAVEFDIRYARLGSRTLALLIDIGVQLVVALVLYFLLSMLIGLAFAGGFGDVALIVAGLAVVSVVVLVGYPAGMETLTRGRTLGKLAMGLRVVRDDGGPIRFRHALTRALVRVALEWPGLLPPLVWVPSLTTMLLNPQGKRLG